MYVEEIAHIIIERSADDAAVAVVEVAKCMLMLRRGRGRERERGGGRRPEELTRAAK